MAKKSLMLVFCMVFVMAALGTFNLVSAADINDTFHINLQTTFSNGSIQNGTFVFSFNITESSSASCLTPIVYNHTTTLATDSRGIASIYLSTTGSGGGNLSALDFDKQYYLCYYRDGTLKDVSQLGRVPYSFRATQVNLSEVSIDSNLSLGNFWAFLNRTGINTTTPQNLLNVIGDINATTSIFSYGLNLTTGYGYALNATSNGISWANANNGTLLNYSSALNGTLATWANVGNGTVAFWSNVVNGTMASWANVVNGTMLSYAQALNNTLMQQANWNATNTSYYLATNPSGFFNTTGNAFTTFNITNGNFTINNQTTYNLFVVNGTNGRVGIGTNTSQNTLNVIGDVNATGTVYGNGSGLTNVNATTLDGYDSSFFMPLNTSVFGDFDFNGGWQNGGFSISGGNIFAQTGYFYNISSLQVTNLNVNGSLLPLDNQFDLGNSTFRWRDLAVARNTVLGSNLTVDTTTLFVDGNSDRVGIITTTPQNTLNVVGDVNATTDVWARRTLNLTSGYLYATNGTFTTWAIVNNGTMLNYSNALNNTLMQQANWNATNTSYFDLNKANTVGAFNQTFDTSTLFIDSVSDRVGIGTTTPAASLEVNGTAAGDILSIKNYVNAQTIRVDNNGHLHMTAGYYINLGATNYLTSGGAGVFDFRGASFGEATGRVQSGLLSVNTTTAPSGGVATFNGNVGIGTTTPQNTLNVVGDANATGTIYAQRTKNLSIGYDYALNGTIGSDTFAANYSNFTTIYGNQLGNASNMTTIYGGQLGNATNRTVMYGNQLGNASNMTTIYGYALNDSLWTLNYSTYLTKPTWAQATNGTILMRFSDWNATNTSYRAIINHTFYNGTNIFFGINTSSPQNQLNVVGDANATGTIFAQTTKNLSIGYDYATNSSNEALWNANYSTYLTKPTWAQATNGTILMRFSDWNATNTSYRAIINHTFYNGTNIFFGINTSTPQNRLNVVGDINATLDIWAYRTLNLTSGYLYATNGTFLTTETQWNANYSTYLTKPTWAQATNGTILMRFSDWNATNKSYTTLANVWGNVTNGTMLSYLQALNNTLMQQANWNATNTSYRAIINHTFYNGTNIFFGINTSTPQNRLNVVGDINATLDIWAYRTLNLTSGYLYATNGTFYLASNPTGYITDGNTNWDNSYGFVTSAVTSVTGSAPIVSSGGTTPDISLTLLKDIVASGTGLSGGADDVLPGADSDVTITLTTNKDIVAGSGLTGGENDVLPGADADTTITVGAGTCITANADDVAVTADCIGDTQLAFNTGQTLTTAGTPTFAGLTLNGNQDSNQNDILDVDKIDANTFDPVYNINGVKYATYLPGMSGGVKEEVSGTVILNSNYVIDFKKQEIGSDLWLFYQVTDFGQNWEKLQVILTPGFNGNVWYTKDPTSKTLTIHGSQAGEVSYRMTANRYDWMKWGNLANTTSTGMILKSKLN